MCHSKQCIELPVENFHLITVLCCTVPEIFKSQLAYKNRLYNMNIKLTFEDFHLGTVLRLIHNRIDTLSQCCALRNSHKSARF